MTKKFILPLLLIFAIQLCFGQQKGNASYYSHKLKGHHTTDGSHYHPDSLTCAHRSLPLGTLVIVRNPKNDKTVVVKVTDRGPRQKRLLIDLSYRAAKLLDIVRDGIAQVEIQEIEFFPGDIPPFLAAPKAFMLPIEKKILHFPG